MDNITKPIFLNQTIHTHTDFLSNTDSDYVSSHYEWTANMMGKIMFSDFFLVDKYFLKAKSRMAFMKICDIWLILGPSL